jgi:hypothetical protein
MDLIGIGSILEGVGKIAGDLVTTDKERLELELEGRKLDLEQARIDQATNLAQVDVNKVEAASSNLFVSGWRPAVGWVGVAGLAYQFLGYPFMQWAWAVGQGVDLIPHGLNAPPRPERRAADDAACRTSRVRGYAVIREEQGRRVKIKNAISFRMKTRIGRVTSP